MRLFAIILLIIVTDAIAEDYNRVIVDKVFDGKTRQEKIDIERQIKEKSKIQYGNGTLQRNPSPLKGEDVLNNIKSFHMGNYKNPPY